MSDLMSALTISTHGMKAQSERIKVISENVANAETTSLTPGGNPYARKTISFKNVMDKESGTNLIQVDKINQDTNVAFTQKYMPNSPAADSNGMVKMSNVDPLVELMDMREAQRSYEANLGMVEQDKTMVNETIGLLKN